MLRILQVISRIENQALEVRMTVKLLVKLRRQGTRIIKAFHTVHGENIPADNTIYRWISRSKEGPEDLTSISETNAEVVRFLLEEDRRIDIHELLRSFGNSVGSVDSILK